MGERRRYIVAGAPLSGKTTFVRQHASVGDLIYDYDTIHQALSGQPTHRHLESMKPYVFAARDGVFNELAANHDQAAWIITSTHRSAELRALKERFRAEVVLLSVNSQEAHKRSDEDGRPAEWHGYIDAWFDNSDLVPDEWPLPQIKSGGRRIMAEQKVFRAPLQFKAEKAGEFAAVFATLNVIDKDRDVTVPGAFEDGEKVRIEPWNHNYGSLPVGKGTIAERDAKAIVEGKFFLTTQAGKDHYETVKELGELQEWSYTFDVLDYSLGKFEGEDVRFLRKLKVHGVAPVYLGAGIDTGTLGIKGAKSPVASHSTATTDAAWDAGENIARARSGEDAAYYAKIYAWRDPDGDPAVKSTYKFPHHMVASDGVPGAANTRACSAGIAVLNGGRGGAAIPDGDRQGVWNHLARHIRDADLEPPELKNIEEPDRKVGARHTAKEVEAIQEIHDRAVMLGAKCAPSEGDSEGEGGPSKADAKPSGDRASVLGMLQEIQSIGES